MDATIPSVAELLETAVSALGGQQRSGQHTMAVAVAESLETGQHLAVQAGTGTGKSLAYLVPALRYAVMLGETVVVSTATIALQRQLCERDLPLLADALAPALGRTPTFALLKGRSNYLCVNALDEAIAVDNPEMASLSDASSPASSPAADITNTRGRSKNAAQAVRVFEWARETETGDRDDLRPGVSDRVWSTVSVDTRACLGATMCPHAHECFAERAREETQHADIVVTNHSLLAIETTSRAHLLPSHQVVIVDEAHDLESRVTSTVSGSLNTRSLERLLKRARTHVSDKDSDRLLAAVEALEKILPSEPVGRWQDIDPDLATVLHLVRSAASNLFHSIGVVTESEASDDPQRAIAKKQVRSSFNEIVDVCDALLDDSGTYVQWISDDERRGRELHVAPITVSSVLRDRLFRDKTVILTSATLAVGGSFSTMARQWGLAASETATYADTQMATSRDTRTLGTDSQPWMSLDVGSPFDHRKSAILYVAQDLPRPGREGVHPEVLERFTELMTAAGGRTLGLCSSRRAAETVAEYLREHTDYTILCQGEDSTSSLVAEFAEDEHSCLIGTLSLWQGVDVPGAACSLVIIDRLPFPRPDDPLMSARQEQINANGGNGFMAVAAAHAGLLLAQGTGRLLRSAQDRGVIAVLDSRLATARYGGYLRRSMPPCWETSDTSLVLDALRRLS